MNRITYRIQNITICHIIPYTQCIQPIVIRKNIDQVRALFLSKDLCTWSGKKSCRKTTNEFV